MSSSSSSSSSSYSVIVFGTGELGTFLVRDFLANGFAVFVGTRNPSSNAAAAARWKDSSGGAVVTVCAVDYDDPSSVEAAVDGKDVVISALVAFPAVDVRIAKACVKVKSVRLFVPSMFGFDYPAPRLHDPTLNTPLIVDKLNSIETIDKLGVCWVAISTHLFSTFALMPLFGIDVHKRSITWSGRSDRQTSMTHPSDIATFTRLVVSQCLSSTLRANRWFYVESFTCTFDQVFDKLRQLDDDDDGQSHHPWTVERTTIDEAQTKRTQDFGAWLRCVFDEGLATKESNDHASVHFTPAYDFDRAIEEALKKQRSSSR